MTKSLTQLKMQEELNQLKVIESIKLCYTAIAKNNAMLKLLEPQLNNPDLLTKKQKRRLRNAINSTNRKITQLNRNIVWLVRKNNMLVHLPMPPTKTVTISKVVTEPHKTVTITKTTKTTTPPPQNTYDPQRMFSSAQRSVIYLRDKGICQICREFTTLDRYDCDHIVPYSLGGATTVDNGQCTCQTCNRSKGNNHV